MEHVIAEYLRQVWEMSGWFYEGQHGVTPGYACDSQIVNFVRISRFHLTRIQNRRDNNRFFKGIRFSATWEAACANRGNRSGFEGSCIGEGISLRTFTENWRRRTNIWWSQSNLRSAAREHIRPSLFLAYVNVISRLTESNIRLFSVDCVIYIK